MNGVYKKWSCIIQCKSAPQIKPRRYSHSLRTNHKGHVHVYNKQWIWNCWGNLGNWLFSSVCFFDFWLWPFSHIFHTIYSILELEPSILHDMCIVCNVLELESIRHAFCKLLLVVGCWLLVVGCCLLVVGSCLFCYYCCSWSCCSCCSFCSCSCSCCCNALFVVAVVVTVSVLCAVGEAKKSVKLCGTKKTENSRNYQGKNNRERHTSVCVVFAIFLAFCNVNLHCGRKTSNFAWHVRHLEDRPFHVAWRMVFAEFCKWYLQHFRTSTFHFAWWLSIFRFVLEALWNLNLLISSFTSWSLHQRKEPKSAKRKHTTAK